MARLRETYKKEIRTALQKEFNYPNAMQVPKITKVVLNMGVGADAVASSKTADTVAKELGLIAGQKPAITRAKKSIAAFKLREEMPVGCKVTLRGDQMYEFLDRLVTVAMPRIRDFRGLNEKSFDGCGNYAFGIKEHIIFPEINYDKVDKIRGLDVVVHTTATNDNEAMALLKGFNFPFRKKEK